MVKKKFTRQELVNNCLNFARVVGFKPHPLQEKIMRSTARFITWLSGARSGKSILAAIIAGSELLLPDRRIWIVGPSYDLAKREFDHTLSFLQSYYYIDRTGLRTRLSDNLQISVPCEGSCKISTPWGSFIETKSTENPKSCLGEELDLLVLAEGANIPRDPYDRYLVGRLGSRMGRQLAFSTGAGDTGIFQTFVANGNDGVPDWETFTSTTLVNPYFSKEEYERNRLLLDEKTFKEQFGGELVSKRGLVFPCKVDNLLFTNNDEMLNKLKVLPILVGVKYNYTNMGCCLIVAYDKITKDYWVLKEICGTKQLFEDLISSTQETLKVFPSFRGYFGDYYDKSTTAEAKRLNLKYVVNDTADKPLGQTKAICTRVRRLQKTIAENRLHIAPQCVNTINEFTLCKWPDSKKEGSDLLEGEAPLPKFFQCLEALSHIITYLEG